LIELIEDVQSGRNDFGNLLVFDVSRWGRFQDVDESAHYEFICRKAGVKVAYCSEQFENDGSLLSSIVKNIKRVMAAEYSRELSAKVHAGALRLARSGYKMGGPATYGLQRQLLDERSQPKGMLARGERKCLLTDRVRLHPGEHGEAEVVKWIFDEYVQGKTHAAIARELNARGISAARGGLWHKNAIGMLLRNEAYIGTYIYNRVTEKLRPPPGWAVIARHGENDEAITDYVLMPTELISLKSPVYWLSKHPHDKRKECFKTFSALSRSLVKRICDVT
jgi:DNA invertase Pin-like site-specific DNA recombinase